jgi:hypothetical protein
MLSRVWEGLMLVAGVVLGSVSDAIGGQDPAAEAIST